MNRLQMLVGAVLTGVLVFAVGQCSIARAQHAFSNFVFVETDFIEMLEDVTGVEGDALWEEENDAMWGALVFTDDPEIHGRSFGVAWLLVVEPNGDMTCNLYLSTHDGQTLEQAQHNPSGLQQSYLQTLYKMCQARAGELIKEKSQSL